jgi:hypothetical protein
MSQPVFTSDLQLRPNGMTREEWLHAILYSNGKVTRIGQHLALVIYHLADHETHVARLSARDLERITGWSKTAIVAHLTEIEAFIRVKWGQGRAKSLFELQGIITEEIERQRSGNKPDATVAATVATNGNGNEAATEVATKVSGREDATQVAATVATNGNGSQEANTQRSCGSQVATNRNEGGTIGGENNNYPSIHTLSHSRAQAPDFMISEDGGFEGKVFELSGLDVQGLRQVYTLLEFPADLVGADQFFAKEFDRKNISPPSDTRKAALHAYLAKRNREVKEMSRVYEVFAASKGDAIRKPAKPLVEPAEPPSCWFDDAARLQVANGFKTELLEAVGGDEIRLRDELDKVAGWVGVNTRGPQLIAKVRSRVIEQVKGTPKESTRESIRKYAEEAEARIRQRVGGRQI